MDKLDLWPPSGLPPKPVRAELSHLTNDVLAFLDGEAPLADVQERLDALRAADRYQSSDRPFRDALEADLRATAEWWEEAWRYHETWPAIRDCLEGEVSGENVEGGVIRVLARRVSAGAVVASVLVVLWELLT